MRVKTDDGHAWFGPQACGQRTGAGQTVGIDDAGVRTHGCLVHVSLQSADWIFRGDARYRQIAVFVVHGGDQHGCERVRIEDRSAVLAGVHWVMQCLDMHVDVGVAAK